MLAVLRGRREGVLAVSVELTPDEELQNPHPAESLIAKHYGIERTVGWPMTGFFPSVVGHGA